MRINKKMTWISAILFLVLGLMGCGKDPLEGTWKNKTYFINEESRKIEYTDSEITFMDGRITRDNNVMTYHLSEEDGYVYIEDGIGEEKKKYDVKENSLVWGNTLYYKIDSEEYQKHCEDVELQAETELKEIIKRIEEEEALIKERENTLKDAVQLWETSINEFIDELENVVSEKQKSIESEVFNILEGVWSVDNGSPIREVFIIENGIYKYELSTFVRKEGNVEVEVIPFLDFSECNNDRLKDESIDINEKLELMKDCPFDESWELEELKKANLYIEDNIGCLYEQIDEIEQLELESLMNDTTRNTLVIELPLEGLPSYKIDVKTLTESSFQFLNSYNVTKQ